MLIDINVAQLLCSRLCHDLAGPAGAVSAGLEILQESVGIKTNDNTGAEAESLIVDSARQMTDRLAFFRMAFGPVGTKGIAASKTHDLIANMLTGSRIKLKWSDDSQKNLPPEGAKLLLNMILIAMDALPKGGILGVNIANIEEKIGIALKASGAKAHLRDDVRSAMDLNISPNGLTARNIHGHYAMCLAASLKSEIELSDDCEAEVHLATCITL